MAVHHVDVDYVRASLGHGGYFFSQPGEIRGKDGGGDHGLEHRIHRS